MPRSPTNCPPAAAPELEAKTARLICATVGLRLRRELDDEATPLPHRLAQLLDELQRRETEN